MKKVWAVVFVLPIEKMIASNCVFLNFDQRKKLKSENKKNGKAKKSWVSEEVQDTLHSLDETIVSHSKDYAPSCTPTNLSTSFDPLQMILFCKSVHGHIKFPVCRV